jgi:hypothetical protein
MSKSAIIFATLLIIFNVTSFNVLGSPNEKNYAYVVINKYGDREYRVEISSKEAENRKHFKVVYDNTGRIVSASDFVNRKCIRRQTYYYYNDYSEFYSKYITYGNDGQVLEITKVDRSPYGRRKSIKWLLKDGELTKYGKYENYTNHFELTKYNARGELLEVVEEYFGANGVRNRNKLFVSKSVYFDSSIDSETGQFTQTDKFNNGQPAGRAVKTYDLKGNLIREDLYSPAKGMVKYGQIEYEDGLRIRESSNKNEWALKYDRNRFLKSASYYRDGKFVCRFEYERYPNGDIKATFSYDKSGQLLAEYPNRQVKYVKKDGRAKDGKETIFHSSFPK